MISIDGTTGIGGAGRRRAGACPSSPAISTPSSSGPTSSARWACAPTPTTPRTPQLSRGFGAEGIGLCRTEHMFLGDRKQIIQTFILNEDEPTCASRPCDELFEAADGRLPTACSRPWTACRSSCACSTRRCTSSWRAPARWTWRSPRLEATGGDAAVIAEKRTLMEQIDAMRRGRTRCWACAAAAWASCIPSCPPCRCAPSPPLRHGSKKEGFDPQPRDHDPARRPWSPSWPSCARVADGDHRRGGRRRAAWSCDIPVGTMIELPRAAVTADEIADAGRLLQLRHQRPHADRRSASSRDDVGGRVRPAVLATEHLLPFNPFATIDPGVAKLVKMGVELGHEGNPDIVLRRVRRAWRRPATPSIPSTACGLDYVSCSPYRVPLARLAAAQAALEAK